MKKLGPTLACAWLCSAACTGQRASAVPGEPVQVAGAQFIAGALPGEPPATPSDAATSPMSPVPLAIDDAVTHPFAPLAAGATHQQFSGLATQDAVAIGVALVDGGTGYWVVPVSSLDPFYPGKVDWGFYADFSPQLPPGRHKLRLVAIDEGGAAGRQVDVSVCIDSIVPDNGHACIPTQSPPAAVISLLWDAPFDLDLHVLRPDGTDVNGKGAARGSSGGAAPDGGPALDRDSLRGCVADGFRREDVVFQSPPAPGVYGIYADPFSSCGQAAARFTVTVYALTGTCPGCTLEPTFVQSGELLALQATGGAAPGLFIHDVELPRSP
jgi:hypothetical protein